MNSKHVDTTEMEEIHSILKNISPVDAIIWKNSSKGRSIYKISSIDYSDTLDVIKVHLKDYDGTISQTENIYIKVSYRDALFKTEVISLERGVLTLELPTKIMAVDSRKNPRTIFSVKDNKQVMLKVIVQHKTSLNSELAFKTLNISKRGICLIVSDNNKVILDNSVALYITSLGNHRLAEEILIDLCYIHRFRYRDSGKLNQVYRAGFELQRELSEDDLSFL